MFVGVRGHKYGRNKNRYATNKREWPWRAIGSALREIMILTHTEPFSFWK
jgi:hypothetical protein